MGEKVEGEKVEYPELMLIEWTDTTNIAAWSPLSDVAEFAKDGAFICRNVGYLVYEDDSCYVLAARVALERVGEEQVGLFERIPKGIVIRTCVLVPREPLSSVTGRPFPSYSMVQAFGKAAWDLHREGSYAPDNR